jgi:hypothetical protein
LQKLQVRMRIGEHPAQDSFVKCPARFVTACIGRQFGKTVGGARWMLKQVAKGKPGDQVWIVAETGKLLLPARHGMRGTWPRDLYEMRLSSPETWTMSNGVEVAFRTGQEQGGLRGFGLIALWVDEAAQLSRRAWQEELAATVAHNQAPVLLTSTPYGKNWFYEEWLKGLSGDYPDHASFQYPSIESPYFPQSEWERLKHELPAQVFGQEYGADFIEGAGSVFRNLEERYRGVLLTEPNKSSRYVMAVDLGKHEDWTVITIADTRTRQMVWYDRFNQLDYEFQKTRIKLAWEKWGKPHCVVDSTGIGDAIVDSLHRDKLPCEGFIFTNQSKKEIVQQLMVDFERGNFYLPPVQVFQEELGAFTYELTAARNIRYTAPAGFHDDCVMSLAMLNYALNKGVLSMESFGVSEDYEPMDGVQYGLV